MGGEIVHHQVDTFTLRVPGTDTSENIEHLLPPFVCTEVSPKHVVVHVIEGKQMAHTMRPAIGCRQTVRLTSDCPNTPMHGAKLNRAKLIITDDMGMDRQMLVESFQPFFLLSKCGSVDSFQVFVR